MCRNIRPLFNFEPPALQFVRKVSGTRTPSGKNQALFAEAVTEIAAITRRLVDSLEAARARANSAHRYAR